MKYIFAFLFVFALLSHTTHNWQKDKYLPVCITILDTSFSQKEIILNLKAAFGLRKIKTISRADQYAYIKSIGESIGQDYIRMGGDLKNFDKFKSYMSLNMTKVSNSLIIDIRIDADGFIHDTVRWDSYSVPIDFLNPPKTKWQYMILDSTNARTILQMSQSIVDSIIASNVLVKE